jgi:hypothetical protein
MSAPRATGIDAPDPDALTIATVGIAGAILLVVAVVVLQGLYERAARGEHQRKVVAEAPLELRTLQAAQRARLHATGWIDKSHGWVAIPIERAMEMLAADKDPAAPIVLPGAGETPVPGASATAAAAAPEKAR